MQHPSLAHEVKSIMRVPTSFPMSPDPSSEKSQSSLEKRLASYGVMSLAIAAATAGGSQPAFAGTVQPPLSTTTTGQVFFSMGGRADTNWFSAADFGLIQTSSQAFFAAFVDRAFLAAPVNGVSLPAVLDSGIQIGTAGQILGTGPSGLKFVTANQTLAAAGGNGLWFPASQRNQPHYVGLRFDVSGSPHYGWAQIQVGTDYNISLLAFSGELYSANTPIAAGAAPTPEPASALLLALGAAGLAAYRCKCRKA